MTTSPCTHQPASIHITIPHVTEAIGSLYSSDPGSNSSSSSSSSYETAVEADNFASEPPLEYSEIQTLRRLSMELMHSPDPDLPSPPDQSQLFWLPAHLHPTLSPVEFHEFIQARLDEVQSCDGLSTPRAGLHRRKSLLSREIDNTDGSGAVGYSDRGSVLSRNRQRFAISDPDVIRSFTKILSPIPNHSIDEDGNMPTDTPILVPLPGQSLRRSAKTFSSRSRGARKPLQRARTFDTSIDLNSSPPDVLPLSLIEASPAQHRRCSKSIETLATVEAIMAPSQRLPVRPRSNSEHGGQSLPTEKTGKFAKKGWKFFANDSKNREKQVKVDKTKEQLLHSKPTPSSNVTHKKEKEQSLFWSLFGSRQNSSLKSSSSSTASSSLSDDTVTVSPTNSSFVHRNVTRYSLHTERAIYRLSVVKISNPRRPLVQQVLLSNFMYGYLNLLNESKPTGPGPGPCKNNRGYSRRHRSNTVSSNSQQQQFEFQFPPVDTLKTSRV